MLFKTLYTRYAERVKPIEGQPVEVQLMGGDSIDILSAFDISIKGIGVKTPGHYEMKEEVAKKVDLVITLPSTRAFKAKGVIRHVTKNKAYRRGCFGVEFTEIAQQNITAIRDYMRHIKESKEAMAS